MARSVCFNLSEDENSRIEVLMALFGFKNMSEFFIEGMDILSDWEEFARHGFTQPVMVNPETGDVAPMNVKYLDGITDRENDLIIPFVKQK